MNCPETGQLVFDFCDREVPTISREATERTNYRLGLRSRVATATVLFLIERAGWRFYRVTTVDLVAKLAQRASVFGAHFQTYQKTDVARPYYFRATSSGEAALRRSV